MSAIQTIIEGHRRELGDGFSVQRVLPSSRARMVGPFIFVDHFGPVQLPAGQGMEVRPHPHIGLATVTYLFEGAIDHRDSIGSLQTIRPGDVNWMTAGRGIVHSERSPGEERACGPRLHGMQIWVALPLELEECAPAFAHHPAATLPQLEFPGVVVRVVVGKAFGQQSPVQVASPTLYCALQLDPAACLTVPAEHPERALYVAEGELEIAGQVIGRGQLAVLTPGVAVPIRARSAVMAMLLGGAPVGERFIEWNFVASSRALIDAAKAEWTRYGDTGARGRFGSVPGEQEFIPLPAR